MDKEKFILLLLLTIITAAGSAAVPSFTFTRSQLTATEGSCVPIQGSFTGHLSENAYWAWLKDPVWVGAGEDFSGTVVYSTDPTKRPISPQYSNRVTYQRAEKQLTISICNLNKNDGGSYSFGYFPSRGEKWSSEPVLLSVQANPCLIRFEEPAPVTESSSVTLHCSTSSSCPSRPQIQPLDQRGISVQPQGDGHSTTATSNFTASWQDNGRQFSCQTQGNTDPNLIRSVTLTVKFSPEVEITASATSIQRGQRMDLRCTVKRSNPDATSFHWQKDQRDVSMSQTYTVISIQPEQAGFYTCTAWNSIGAGTSDPLQIQVEWFAGILSGSRCERDSAALTCVCGSQGHPLPSISWPLLTDHSDSHIQTNVSGDEIWSSFSVKDGHSVKTVVCVVTHENGETKQELLVLNHESSLTKFLKLEFLIAFLTRIVLSAVIFFLFHQYFSKKEFGRPEETAEMANMADDPQTDDGYQPVDIELEE
ncbi:B-cell receptor CD22-like isoform X1 [Synchiropus splendidus]|uniref:B-cell receptor CD22-like isoform X1 n=1 Tax=Synchiropus splendidus TaxID=270530 RepID=UPI00237DB812|nr:B-cell receptor CD22-like isoform X1 [Synchiropus splendidus]